MDESTRIKSPSAFQSTPGPKSGRYLNGLLALLQHDLFQSTPGPKSGRYLSERVETLEAALFQSTPGPKSGRYPNIISQS